jgi:signal transduction histidine kinase
MGFNRFIYLLFAVSVVVLCWLGYTYAEQNKAQLKYTAGVEHTYQVIIAAQYCEKLLLDAESKQRGFIITRDEHFRRSAGYSVVKIDSTWNALRTLSADNPNQRVNLHLLKLVINQRLAILKRNFEMPAAEKVRRERLGNGQLLMEKIHVYIRAIEHEEEMLLVERSLAKNHYQSLNFIYVKYGFFFACLVCVAAIFLIIRELRKRVRAQALLERTVLELKRSNEELEQITFTASHDLQEPLRKIGTLSTLLNRKIGGTAGDEEKDILQRIEKSTGKMQRLLNDLVNFTVLLNTTGEPRHVDLDAVFKAAFDAIKKEDPTIKLNLYGTLPQIPGYQPQLDMLFTQLLGNALKYKDPNKTLIINVTYRLSGGDGITATIWKKERTKRYHEITISDNGIGFSNDFKEKIFVLFQRLHTNEVYAGKGMGLSLARRIVTNHYGHIEANGEEGVGGTFRMYFPA